MSIVLISPGTGSFHCGTCLRDDGLAHALRGIGREVLVVPLYLPQVTDRPCAAGDTPIFFGGVKVYLQQRSALFRHAPAWVDRLLDAPAVLAAAGRRAGATKAAELGELTLSMLRGERGRQSRELDRLVRYLETRSPRPTAICLSNALLTGMAARLRERLGVPVVVTLQGEDPFLDALPEPHRTRAWEELARRAREVDAFVAVSRYHGDTMRRRLGLVEGRVHVIYNGLDVAGYAPADRDPEPATVGFLARMCEDKGLGTAIDAFLELKRRPGMSATRLHVVGARTSADEPYVARLRERIAAAGVDGDVAFHPNPSLEEKQRLLRELSVLSVPAAYGESFGLYLLEAWASGVPVVQPRLAAFEELLESTGAGVLTDGTDPALLADAIASLLADPERRRALGARGREAVLDRFTAARMAREVGALLDGLASRAA